MDKEFIGTAVLCTFLMAVAASLICLRLIYDTELHIPRAAAVAADMVDAAVDSVFSESGEAGIIRALILGRKDEIPYEITSAYRKSGASHLLALSGLHLGTIYYIIGMLFVGKSLWWTRARGIVCILVMGFYAMMTGLSDSTARAFIMIAIYECGNMTGRKQKSLRVLGMSAVVIVCVNPDAFLNVGFQLSYCAMLGIFLLFPHLKPLVHTDNRAMKYLWNTIALSVACQIATLPAVMWYFGYFPKYFLITNLLSIPLMSLILPLLLVSVGLWFVWPDASGITAYAAVVLVRVMNEINLLIAGMC